MGRQLDRSRKFATSFGETNLRFYQDGRYFDAGGNEVETAPVENRKEPPLGAGKPAGKVPVGAKSTATAADATTQKATSGDELRAQLSGLNFTQVKKIFVTKGGDLDQAKGPGSVARMVEWLVVKHNEEAAAAG
jgi:hypothetical protein